MSRVLVICEGQTEAAFVRDCLQPYLLDKGVYVFVENMRGNVSSQRVAHFVRNNFRSFDKITTLLDFYGFQDREQDSRQALEAFIAMTAQGIMPQADMTEKFLPYVQMYEFEGLLFSDVSQFEWVQDGWNTNAARQLQAIRNAFDNPELINNSPLTAPSKRLGAVFAHHYKKVEHGSIIAESIGLQTIRDQCPNFNEWLTWLESL
jgi:hypothetical protein